MPGLFGVGVILGRFAVSFDGLTVQAGFLSFLNWSMRCQNSDFR